MREIIRWATIQDAADLLRLNHEFNGIQRTISEVKESLSQSNEFVALAIKDDIPVGFACAQFFKSFCYPDLQGEITELYINESSRREGLATQLIAFLEEELQNRAVKRVKVITNRMNDRAIKTYKKSQYATMEDLIMQKNILPQVKQRK